MMADKDYKNTPEGRKTAEKYADIIHMERPASSRPKMDLTHRAKIFSPYDALRGFDEAIDELHEMADRTEKQQLSEGALEELSEKFSCVRPGMHVSLTYFAEDPDGLGKYKTIEGVVEKIDSVRKEIYIAEDKAEENGRKLEKQLSTVISFEDIKDVEGSGISDTDDFAE